MSLIQLKEAILERIEELEMEWKEEPSKNSNHLASMLLGEIDGLQWVIEEMKEL